MIQASELFAFLIQPLAGKHTVFNLFFYFFLLCWIIYISFILEKNISRKQLLFPYSWYLRQFMFVKYSSNTAYQGCMYCSLKSCDTMTSGCQNINFDVDVEKQRANKLNKATWRWVIKHASCGIIVTWLWRHHPCAGWQGGLEVRTPEHVRWLYM